MSSMEIASSAAAKANAASVKVVSRVTSSPRCGKVSASGAPDMALVLVTMGLRGGF
jgi:hypothetical protein